MKRISIQLLLISLFFTSLLSCSKDDNYTAVDDDPIAESPVVLDLAQVPYDKLSEYNFFSGDMKEQNPVLGVLPFEPISSLFTDYAKKKRFVWMPKNSKATYQGDGTILDFPVGTALIKTFYYENVQPSNSKKIIETRLMIKKQTGWIFANYVWNENQTEALLDNQGSFVDLSWLEAGQPKQTTYRIPSEAECLTCHKKSDNPIPIGPKPQNINSLYTYSDGSKNQLAKWIEMGYLDGSNVPGNIESLVKWNDASQPLELRVRSYIDINCAHCHAENSHCDYRPIRLAFNETSNPMNLGICVTPDEFINSSLSYIIAPGNYQRSALHYRLTTNEENLRMPLMGRSMVHQEGVEMIEEWINSLTQVCN